MTLDSAQVVSTVVIGLGATLLMDVWNLFLLRMFAIRSLDYCLLGRWVCHMSSGTFRHAHIGRSAAKPHECRVGWLTHYSIGIGLAVTFVALAPEDWLAAPRPLPALLFGVSTVVFPLFVMQPALGLGLASSKTPNPAQARAKSLATHAVFGVGLYVWALGLGRVLPVP